MPDLSHAELYAEIKEARKAAEDAATAAEGRDRAIEEHLRALRERLDAGGPRFGRIERLLEESAADRRELNKSVTELSRRILAIETARKIASGVDEGVQQRVSAWRKWAGRGLLLIFGQGTGMMVLIWWLERHPPSGG